MCEESHLGLFFAKEDAAYGKICEFSCSVFSKVRYLQKIGAVGKMKRSFDDLLSV